MLQLLQQESQLQVIFFPLFFLLTLEHITNNIIMAKIPPTIIYWIVWLIYAFYYTNITLLKNVHK